MQRVLSCSFEQFLEVEPTGDQAKLEYVGGRVFAMSWATERHELLAGLAYSALAPGALAAGCRPFMSSRLVKLGDAAYVPDVMVSCGRAGHLRYETDVRVVVEVLSPSTESVDRREKALAYSRAPSFEIYVLLDPARPVAEVASLDAGWLRWSSHDVGAAIETSVGVLDVAALHDQLDAIATTAG